MFVAAFAILVASHVILAGETYALHDGIDSLSITLETDKETYSPGENITLYLSVSNPSNGTLNLTMLNSCYAMFSVFPEGNNTAIYSSHQGFPCLPIITTLTWRHNETRYWNFTWSQDNNTAPFSVEPGRYVIQGYLNTIDQLLPSQNITIHISHDNETPGFGSITILPVLLITMAAMSIAKRKTIRGR